MAWFRRNNAESMDTQYLLAQAHESTPLEPTPTQATTLEPTASAPGAATGFRMTIEDVFTITGRGTVVTGRIAAGTVASGSTVRLTRTDGSARDLDITGIEMFRKQVDSASTGDNVGLLLHAVTRDDVGAGDVVSS
jgi:translation elongation factor EF-Tu-like GTPase